MIENLSPDIEQELLEAVRAECDDAIGYYDTTLTGKQSLAIQYYEGKPFGNEVEGRSQYVAPDCAEASDYMLQSVKRTILQSDAPVVFYVSEGMEEGQDTLAMGKEVTKAINYMFMRKQDGDKFVTDTLQSGLNEDFGVAKTVSETKKKRKRQTLIANNEIELAFIQQKAEEGEFEVIFQGEVNNKGQYRVKVQTEEEVTEYLDIPIPSEEFLFASRTSREDSSPYLAHRCTKFMSDLIEMGFDRDKVESLPVDHTDTATDERGFNRWDDEEWTRTERKGVMRSVVLHEEYMKFDIDDDGVAELVQIFRVENEILSVEEVDEQPFSVWSPFPRAHRMTGTGIVDKTMDIQLVRSMIFRNMLDGFASDNYPRPLINEMNMSENTIPDLLNPAPGAPIRYAGDMPQPYPTTFDLGKGAQFLEIFSGEKESRTGITRMNQGMDKEALNKTMGGTALMMDKGEQFEEYVGGNYANFLSKLFMKKFNLIKENGETFSYRDGNKVVEVDPSTWGEMECVPMIGPTRGNRLAQKEARAVLLELQKELAMNGSNLVDEQKIYNLVEDAMGDERLGQTDRYFNNPEEIEGVEQVEEQPDPEMLKAKADAQIKASDLEHQQKMTETKMALQAQENQAQMMMNKVKSDQEIELAWAKAEAEFELAEWKADKEHELAKKKANDTNLSDNRSGGNLAA